MAENEPYLSAIEALNPPPKSPLLIQAAAFGKYTLIAKLGHGGMSEVFLAYISGPARFRKLIVLKRLHPHLEDEPQFVEMFLDEARLAARLNHPNVVQTYEVGEIEGQHFIAMEHLEGQALDHIWKRCRMTVTSLPTNLAAYIVCQALGGLHYAHEHKDYSGVPLEIVHRDVSPQNVFVTYEGQVKLLDFGIAKASTQVSVTHAGVIKGKYAYIAPEQAEGEDIDRRADLWSMGVVLWEILAGKRLFKAHSEFATLRKTLSGKIPSLRETAPDVPEALANVTEKALTASPENRYQTALEMKEDIESYLSTQTPTPAYGEVSSFVKKAFEEEIRSYQSILEACIREHSDVSAIVTSTAPRHAHRDLEDVERTPTTGILVPASESPSPPETPHDEPSIEPETEEPPTPERSSRKVPIAIAVVIGILAVIGLLFLYSTRSPSIGQATLEQPDHIREETRAPEVEIVTEEGSEESEHVSPVSIGLGQSGADAAADGATEEMDGGSDGGQPPAVVASKTTKRVRPQLPRSSKTTQTKALRYKTQKTPPPPEEGYLSIDTVPWSQVSLGGKALGNTPIIRTKLPAGIHVLTLRNPEVGITTTYRVNIKAGEVTARRTALQ